MENQGFPGTPGGNFRCISVSQERNELAAKFQRLPHIFDHGRLTRTSVDIVRCRPTTGNSNGGLYKWYKHEVVITQERYEISARFQRILDIFDHAQHGGAISNIVLCRPTTGNTMAACKPEVVITQQRNEIAAKSQRLPLHFRPWPTHWNWSRHCPMSADNGNSNAISGCRLDVARHRTMLEIAPPCWAWSKKSSIR